MEIDLEQKLYDDYRNGDKEALGILYNRYKSRIEYFIYNIVKDYQKAQDLTQETFIYIMKHRIKENCSFKCTIYLIAKSKAYNYINIENRRNEIENVYLNKVDNLIENDALEYIERVEAKNEILQAIELLDKRYRDAIYLVKIEELSYEETAKILGESIQNTKNLVHRGKKQLRKILLKKGFDNMNKVSKVIVAIICILLVSGVAYGITSIVKKFTYDNVTLNPTYQSTIDEHTINNLWVGTLDLAWKELEEQLGLNTIQIVGNDMPQIVSDLNTSIFTKDMLNKNDYEISIEEEYNRKKINATLNKELSFLEPFDNFNDLYREKTFGDGEEYIKYFGINNGTEESVNQNVEVLFYNDESSDFAIKLKTREGDEIILYRTDENKSFDKYYEDIKRKSKMYDGSRELVYGEELYIPYVRVNGFISYSDLYNKEIEGTNGKYIADVIQNVDFYLNEEGCNLSSKASLITEYNSIINRIFDFTDTFIIFMKEKDAEMPYFALKIDNDDILEKIEDKYTGPAILDFTERNHSEFDVSEIKSGEYKFYEDENYEYYYPTQKTDFVRICLYPYREIGMTAEEALEKNLITIETFDRYGIKYIKKKNSFK